MEDLSGGRMYFSWGSAANFLMYFYRVFECFLGYSSADMLVAVGLACDGNWVSQLQSRAFDRGARIELCLYSLSRTC